MRQREFTAVLATVTAWPSAVSHAMTGGRAKALAAGCDEYETKPIDFALLRAKIDALLRKRAGDGQP